MSNFADWYKKEKNSAIFWVAVILAILLSFGSGYLIAREKNPAPIIIEKNSP